MKKQIILLMALLFATLVSMGTNWYVDPSGTDDGTHGHGTGVNAFKTISYAITSAAANDVIYVAAGTYNEAAVVNKSLTLLGAQANVIPVAGGRPGGESVIDGNGNISTDGISIEADNVVMNGFEVAEWNIPIATNNWGNGGSGGLHQNVQIIYNYVHSTVTDNAGIALGQNIGYDNLGNPLVLISILTNYTISHNLVNIISGNSTMAAIAISGGTLPGGSITYNNLIISNNELTNPTGRAIFAGADPTYSLYNNTAITYNNIHDLGHSSINMANLVNSDISHNVFTNVKGDGAYVNMSGGTFTYNTISGMEGTYGFDLELWGNDYGSTQYSNNVEIAHNSFTYNDISTAHYTAGLWMDGDGVYSATMNVHDNTFIDAAAGSSVGCYAVANDGASTLDISTGNNIFNGITLNGTTTLSNLYTIKDKVLDKVDAVTDVFDGWTLGYVILRANNVYVTQNSFDNVYGNTTSALIQRGINAATSGNIVNVAAGDYNERITINKSLSLLGAQNSIDPTPTGVRTNASLESIIDVTGLSAPNPNLAVEIPLGTINVTLDGFTVIGTPTWVHADDGAIRCWDDHITIQNNIISGYVGIIYKGNDYFNVLQNRITSNKNGVVVQPGSSTNINITGNSVALGTSPSTDLSAIYITGLTTGTVNSNKITGWNINSGRALYFSGVNYVNVTSNTLTNNNDGISIFGGSTFINISQNTINNNMRYGINIKGSDLVISNNFITGNLSGISLDRNVIDTKRVTISKNDLSGNTSFGLILNAAVLSADVDATCNWWGSTVGSVISLKISASPTQPNYTPWLISNTDGDLVTPGFQPSASCFAPCNLVLSTSSTQATCPSLNNGTASVSVTSGGSGSYSYLWSPGGQITSPATNLIAGTYNVTVTDPDGCTATTSVVVSNSLAGPVHDVNTGLNYCTIQAAISAASSNDIINVSSGTYTENLDAVTGGKNLTFSPGNSPGCVTINGNMLLNTGDGLIMDINGTNPCNLYDQWTVNGTVTLGGANLILNLGYTPANGDQFTLISNDGTDAIVGQFAQGNSITAGGTTFNINYSGGDGNDVVLTACGAGSVHNITMSTNYCKIQDAINAASANNLIVVDAGTYSENIILNKGIILQGANYGVAGCTGRAPESQINGGTGIGVDITSDDASVIGFAISGSTGVRSYGHINVVIKNNVINGTAAGVDLRNTATTALKNVEISGNCITLSSQFAGANQTMGIFMHTISGVQAPVISNNIISGPFYGYLLYNVNATPATVISGGSITGIMQGISIVNLDPLTLASLAASKVNAENVIISGFAGNYPSVPSYNFYAGIYTYTGGPDPSKTITSNINNVSVTGTGRISPDCAGMYFGDFSTATSTMQNIHVTASTVTDNLNRGIYIRGAKTIAEIETSTLTNNGSNPYGTGGNYGYGIMIRQNATVNIHNCFINNPATQVAYTSTAISTDNGTNVTANNNSIPINGNASAYLAAGGSGTMNATCNWWGTIIPATIAAKISGSVTFTPFLVVGTDNDSNPANGFQPVSGSCAPALYVNDAVMGGEIWTTAIGSDITGIGSYTAPYKTITKAISMASSGNIIYVDAGTYAENVVVNKSLTINGTNAGISGLSLSRNTESILSGSGTQFTIGAGYTVNLDGFQYTGVYFINSSCDNLSVKDCKFTWTSHFGQNDIYLSNAFKYFAFENNSVILTADVGAAIQPSGNYNGSGAASNLYISGNYFDNPGAYATWAFPLNLSSCQGEITNNTFYECGGGILLAGKCGNLTIDKNTFSWMADYYDGDYITGIKLWGNGNGSSILSGPINITNNFFDNCDYGVCTNNSPLTLGAAVNINNNSFTNISFYAMRNAATAGTFNASCNWYGTTAATDIANLITGNVTYAPWLIDGHDGDLATPGFQPLVPCESCGTLSAITTTTNASCSSGVANGSATAVAAGGTAPYSYLWPPAAGSQTTMKALYLLPGTYSVTVTDFTGCTAIAGATVSGNPDGPLTRAAQVAGCAMNQIVTVPIRVHLFNNVGAISLTLLYNHADLHYEGYTNGDITNWMIFDNPNFHNTGLNGIRAAANFTTNTTLGDSAVIINLSFTILTPGVHLLTWNDDDGVSCEYAEYVNYWPNYIPFCDIPTSSFYFNGSVTGNGVTTAGVIADNQTICSGGDPAAFTSTTDGSGYGTITYRWEKSTDPFSTWTVISGANGNTYDAPSGLTEDTKYRRVTISTLNGFTCEAISNVLTVTVNNLTAGVIADDQTICEGGNPAAFTEVTAATYDGTPTYRWESSVTPFSTWTIIGGATANVYDAPAGLMQDTKYHRVTISTLNGVPCEAISNDVTVTVNNLTAGVIADDQTICEGGNPAAFTEVTAATYDGTPTYRWESSVTPFSTWTIIGGATTNVYNAPAGLMQDTKYHRVTISTLNGVPCEAISNDVTVTVNNLTAGVITDDQTICEGGNPAAFTEVTAATYDGTPTYRWESSVTPFSTWTIIGGATANVYDAPAGLMQDTKYHRVTISTLNGVPCEAISNDVTVTMNNLTAGVIADDQTICEGGNPAAFTEVTAATYDGTPTYRWESSVTPFSTWTIIGGATANVYDAPAGLMQDTKYHRVSISTLNGVPCEAISNDVTVTVNNLTAGAIAADQTICTGNAPVAFTSITDGSGDGAITYRWERSVSPFTVWNTIPGAVNSTYSPGILTQTTEYRRVTISTLNLLACEALSNVVTITVNSVSNITGTINYYNVPSTAMDNVVVTLWQNGSPTSYVTPATPSSGVYTFTGVCPGTYEVRAVSQKVIGGAINATDASQVNSWGAVGYNNAGPVAIERVQFYAGDVTGGGINATDGYHINSYLSSDDGYRILLYFVYSGSIPISYGGPQYSLRGNWVFWWTGDPLVTINGPASPTIVYPTVNVPSTGGTITKNLWALATGDFNLSFIPATGPLSGKSLSGKNLSLEHKGEKTATANSIIELPVRAEQTMTVDAGSVIMNFPSDKMEITDVTMPNASGANLLFHADGNELRIGWYGGMPSNLIAGQTLFILKVRTNVTVGKSDNLNISLVESDLNELANNYSEVIAGAKLSIEHLTASADALGIGSNAAAVSQNMSLYNYPNPFAGTTTFDYVLPQNGKVTLEVYNLVGKKVMVLLDEVQIAGDHSLTVDASTLPVGFYTVTLLLNTETGVQTRTIKIIRN